MIKLKNPKLVKYIKEKDALVADGRAISKELKKMEKKMQRCEAKERKITAKVQPKELGDKAEALKKEINDKIQEFEKVAQEIQKVKLESIPEELEKEHKELMAQKEKKERERNKIALKVQKLKDRIIPIVQKELKPKLKKYEDLETAEVKGDEVVVKTFSHLDDWKKRWDERNTEKQNT